MISEHEITRTPCSRAQRTASRNECGSFGSQLISISSAAGATACTTSAQSTPCWLLVSSSLPSVRNERVVTCAGRALPSWAW